jgi:LemA protein
MATYGTPIQRDVPLMRRSMGPLVVLFGILVLAGLAALGFVASRYNQLVRLDQNVLAQWAQVENAYQRRADLVPNLVQAVKGAANFEQSTLVAVTEARSRVGQPRNTPPASQKDLEQYQQQQDQLGGALSRLLVVAEAYPELKATQGFRDLQAQLEGTENRIAVERMRFNESSRTFNSERNSFPTNLVAGVFGSRFEPKAYFRATEGAQRAPEVRF